MDAAMALPDDNNRLPMPNLKQLSSEKLQKGGLFLSLFLSLSLSFFVSLDDMDAAMALPDDNNRLHAQPQAALL
jgi:hypothetical protein